ncbi:hypothetical protein CCP4SC76_810003 [Gammaproteobacteria bacterium]
MATTDSTLISTLVEIHGQQALTNSITVAEGCELEHKEAIATVRKYQSDFEELGPLAFETRLARRKQGGGIPTEYAILNEDQATYLIMSFRNTPIVRRFKLALVKAFRKAINEINRLYANPPRTDILAAKRTANRDDGRPCRGESRTWQGDRRASFLVRVEAMQRCRDRQVCQDRREDPEQRGCGVA